MNLCPRCLSCVVVLLLSAFFAAGCEDEPRSHRHGRTASDRPDARNPDYDDPTESYGRSGYGGLQPAEAVVIKPGHPRLFLTKAGAFPDGDTQALAWRTALVQRADGLLNKSPIDYSATKLLTRSREAVRRITLFGCVYQFTRDPKYADAGRRELLNVCNFDTWQPDDYLATAEMMTAVAIGYDWLYDALPPGDRRTIADAIVHLGLEPALEQYASRQGWSVAHHNWNMVCNGGVICGALAIAEEQPAVARRALNNALASLRNGLSEYDPQGGTPEGPMYHNYATRYLTYAAAALQTASTVPVSLEAIDANWTHAGDYRIQTTSPVEQIDPVNHTSMGRLCANFGDCDEVMGNSAWMFWHAKRFNHPEYASFETDQDQTSPSAFDLLWYTPGRPAALPLAAKFGSLVTMRTRFDDPNATFVAVRCGTNAANHTHLDLGTFVLDMLGQRFASDLGADNYDLPGILNKRKPDYLRSSTPGHNTLTVGDASQPADAIADGDLLRLGPTGTTAHVDLTGAYPGVRAATRDVTLSPTGDVTVTDNVRFTFSGPVTWHLHTAAQVTPIRGGAMLHNGGKDVELRIVQPVGARLTVEPDTTEPPAKPIDGISHVRIISPSARETHFVVEFRAVVR